MRLDLSFKLSGNLKSNKIANPHWIFSVYNLLGRQNVYSIYFRNENKQLKVISFQFSDRPFRRSASTLTFKEMENYITYNTSFNADYFRLHHPVYT